MCCIYIALFVIMNLRFLKKNKRYLDQSIFSYTSYFEIRDNNIKIQKTARGN